MTGAPLTVMGAVLGRLQRLAAALVLAGALPLAAAQTTGQADMIDPPGRVGGISLLSGPVTLVDLSTGSREEALRNWPVTSGWRLETGRAGRVEVRIGSTVIQLDEDATVDFVRIDDQFMQIAALRGAVSLRLRSRDALAAFEVLTQRERIAFDDPGRYRIDVDRPPGVTAVTSFGGRVRIASGDNTFVVAAGQRGEIASSPMTRFRLSAAVPDRFDDWVAERDAREDSARSTAYVSPETTGVEMLDQYGDWRVVEDYGAVWFPRVAVTTWAPYRYGRWVWVSPWGWTWIDDAPWGFAPLHYGRWVVVGSAWGWVPGAIVPRPVYAPALVAWYGAPAGRHGAPVGWFPLGPREPYVPAYRHSPRYLRVINVQNVPNVEHVTIVQTPRYVNQHPDRSTWVANDRFGRPEPVHGGQRPSPSEWRQYIARPQPPSNVPNTKRRQAVDVPATTPSPAAPRAFESRPAPGSSTVPSSRAPGMPRAVEDPRQAPRTGEIARPIESSPAVRAPGQQPSPASQDSRQVRPERPAEQSGDRRKAPRAPLPATTTPTTPQARPVERPPEFQVNPPQVRPPTVETPTVRTDRSGGAREVRQPPHRGPDMPPRSAPPQVAPAPAAPPQAAPSRVAPPQVAPRQVAPPRPPATARPPQAAPDDSGGQRQGQRPPYEMTR